MRDFAIVLDNGQAVLDLGAETTGIFNNVWLSVTVKKGTFFHDPDFGLRDRGRMKNTERNAMLVRSDYIEALQWLLDVGRAKSVDVSIERDRLQDLNRLKILVAVTAADGQVVSFTTFKEVY